MFALIIAANTIASFGQNEKPQNRLEMAEDGIMLYDSFRFASANGGDLSAVYDLQQKEIVPPGAVMVVIKNAYSIGYYIGDAHYFRGDEKIKLPKVFFVIHQDGSIAFHHPHEANNNFFGDPIQLDIIFEQHDH